MGKAKKLKISKSVRNVPLDKQIQDDESVKTSTRVKKSGIQKEDETFVDDKLSKKILAQARKQQEDLEEEFGSNNVPNSQEKKNKKTTTLSSFSVEDASDSESQSDLDESSYYEKIDVDDDDEKALEAFMNKETAVRRTLGDIIKEKLTEKETEIQMQFSVEGSIKMADLDEKVVEMYKGVRQVLSHYRSGKLPKAFKIIPALSNWEQILHITDPDIWTAAAMYQATRIFASNLKDRMAQRFFNLVLLPRIQDDLAEYKKLNFHLFQALRKALFKPGAFFKGIILPLCESRSCTLREAIIIGSVMAKNSIPVLHSSAALLKIAEMEYSGANSIFMRVLLDKKYALPYQVIDAIVYHFLRFHTDKRELPVLWHQCFLTFVQRYKEDLSNEQKESLLNLLKVQSHQKITPEIRRELQNSKCRDVESMVDT